MSVNEYQVGPITVFYSTRRFAHERIAKQAWEDINHKLAGKGFDLGLYRHGPSENPGRLVTALSLRREGVATADVIMAGEGVEVDVSDDGDMSVLELEALIARRARVVRDHGDQAGHMEIRGGSRRLNPDGTMR